MRGVPHILALSTSVRSPTGPRTGWSGDGAPDTGVEDLPGQPADLTGEPNPPDGGLGRNPRFQGGFGDGTFNIPSLVEAADTGPFFHNNASATLEDAVAFYNSPAFNNSPAAQGIAGDINLTATQVLEVAAFLRVINALENIRSAIAFLQQTVRLDLAVTEISDALAVLRSGGLHPEAVALLEEAQSLIGQQRIPEAIKQAKDARALLLDDGSLDSDVATVSMAVMAAPAPPSGAGGGGCFIATATYGSPWHPHVNILRAFRDQYLLTNSVGARLVRLYYTYSPPIAEYIREHPIARRGARVAFVPLIGLAAFLLQTTGAEKVAVAVLILFIGVSYGYRRRIRRRKVKKPNVLLPRCCLRASRFRCFGVEEHNRLC